RKWIANGYIITAPTLRELAALIDCDPANLEDSAARMTRYAAEGHDPDFGKGGNASDRSMGDPNHGPNAWLGPMSAPPIHAVRILPGDSTTTLGLRVDARARVLDGAGAPIPGLYAAGLDMNSLWRGAPPANGGNNTLSLTFGYLAALDMAASPEG